MSSYSIKQLELVSGIKAHTIRMWEKRYGLFTPQRTKTNIRRYTDLDVQLILNISLLTRNGYRISKIANKSLEEISELILKLSTKESPSNKNDLEPLILSMLSFDQSDFKFQINNKIAIRGLEKTFEELIIPFLYRIGILWQTGMINSTHEHFISNLIKHSIIYHSETLKEPKKDSNLVLFFLPEGEFHEIGLLFYNYIAKKNGYRTLYLGQSTPVEEVIKTAKEIKAKIIFLSASTSISELNISDILKTIQKSLPNCSLFITGRLAQKEFSSFPKSIITISSYESFANKLITQKIK